jgi:UDP-glucose 4-epimerase
MNKIMITGGAGFIGSSLTSKLIALGNKVLVLDDFSRGSKDFLPKSDFLEVYETDIRDTESVANLAIGCNSIIHLAAYGSVVESVEEPRVNFSVNVEGTFSVLNAARQAGVSKLIFASTGGALIGNAPPPVDEKSLPKPISPYGASKLAGEGYCCAFAHSFDMDVISLRFANVIGPQSLHKRGAVTNFFKAIMDSKPITIYGDGSATRDFLYVDDLCQGIVKALNSSLKGFNVFHLASGQEVSIKDLAQLCIKVSGRDSCRIVFEPKRDGEVDRNFASSALANESLVFTPKCNITDALKITWEWFSRNYNTQC